MTGDRWAVAVKARAWACVAPALLLGLAATSARAADGGHDAAFPEPCHYGDAQAGLTPAARCARRDGDGIVLAPAIRARLGFDGALAAVAVGGDWYYVHRDGRAMRMHTFDNGPDYFQEGLARARLRTGIAYVDRDLRVRLRTGYAFATPFQDGVAEGCHDCRTVPAGGEHTAVVGGRWDRFDRAGTVIDTAPRRAGGGMPFPR